MQLANISPKNLNVREKTNDDGDLVKRALKPISFPGYCRENGLKPKEARKGYAELCRTFTKGQNMASADTHSDPDFEAYGMEETVQKSGRRVRTFKYISKVKTAADVAAEKDAEIEKLKAMIAELKNK